MVFVLFCCSLTASSLGRGPCPSWCPQQWGLPWGYVAHMWPLDLPMERKLSVASHRLFNYWKNLLNEWLIYLFFIFIFYPCENILYRSMLFYTVYLIILFDPSQVLMNVLSSRKNMSDSLAYGRLHPQLKPNILLVDCEFSLLMQP